MNIYLVRHGETDWNAEKRIQGQTDVSLNHNGFHQAMGAVDYIKPLNFDKVYTSALARAIQTAEIITGGKYPLIKCSELNERHFGNWQTRLWAEIHEEITDLEDIWARDGLSYRPTNGESLQDLYDRSTGKFNEIINSNESLDNILIVAHGGPLKAIIGYIEGTNPNNIHNSQSLGNCSITKAVHKEGKVSLEFVNHIN